MGMCVVGLAILGLSVLLLVFGKLGVIENMVVDGVYNPVAADHVLQILFGFSLGASSIALFARVGGGIYTKAADVGADLVGKVEAGIPEDDPRNPATIADNVGDNVGDVAGMGADLFESYIGAIIGAMILGYGFGLDFILLPLIIAAVGILVSIGGTFFVKVKEGEDPQNALNIGTFGAAIVMVPVIFGLSYWLIGDFEATDAWWKVGVAAVAGLAAGVAVGITTEHYCAVGKGPVNKIAAASERGSAPNIIAGIAIGFESTALPILWIGGAILAANWAAGLYGIAIAALGMLCTTGIQLAVDAYGPVADNAGGLAEMSKLPPEVRERTDKLDAVGNTTAAIGKGFAIASAALTALALFAAYKQQAGIATIDITEPHRAQDYGGPLSRRHASIPLLSHGYQRSGRGRRRHDRRGSPTVPRDSWPS
jgi:K(+)-stimulated pyrophosphate-energized sodium pump